MDHKVYRMDPVVYSGRDVMTNFFRHIFSEVKAICAILTCVVPMAPLTASERADFDRTSFLCNCRSRFSQTNPKTHHHNDVSSRYLFLASCNCNLSLKLHKCGVVSAEVMDGLSSCRSCFTICRLTTVTSCCSSFARNTPGIW